MELAELCAILGWQGGTIHQVREEITRLRRMESLMPRITPGGMVHFPPHCAISIDVLLRGRGPIVRRRFDEWVDAVQDMQRDAEPVESPGRESGPPEAAPGSEAAYSVPGDSTVPKSLEALADEVIAAGCPHNFRGTILGALHDAREYAQVEALHPYMQVQRILDEVIGEREEDGAGAGIEADVRLALGRAYHSGAEDMRERTANAMPPGWSSVGDASTHLADMVRGIALPMYPSSRRDPLRCQKCAGTGGDPESPCDECNGAGTFGHRLPKDFAPLPTDDGGPAFPVQVSELTGSADAAPGMSLRDWFAGTAQRWDPEMTVGTCKAMIGLRDEDEYDPLIHWPKVEAVLRYRQADAMIAAAIRSRGAKREGRE